MVVFVPMATDSGNSFSVARRKCPVVTRKTVRRVRDIGSPWQSCQRPVCLRLLAPLGRACVGPSVGENGLVYFP